MAYRHSFAISPLAWSWPFRKICEMTSRRLWAGIEMPRDLIVYCVGCPKQDSVEPNLNPLCCERSRTEWFIVDYGHVFMWWLNTSSLFPAFRLKKSIVRQYFIYFDIDVTSLPSLSLNFVLEAGFTSLFVGNSFTRMNNLIYAYISLDNKWNKAWPAPLCCQFHFMENKNNPMVLLNFKVP